VRIGVKSLRVIVTNPKREVLQHKEMRAATYAEMEQGYLVLD
jgi:hypothetical protein